MTIFLKHLIEEHHRLFTDLYPQNNLIPKHHFMIHYPECIRQIGPLLKNLKNITKSLAKKHQIAVAYHWESLSANGIESGPVKSKILTDDLISEHFQIDMSSDIHETTWVKHNGIEYHTGLVVCTDVVNDMPVFMKIIGIFLRN
ncbi:hypothetical protein N1851_006428 [Merluccius polli]|uniref:Uncharacterized protein n=1 Tax=Merluccius polli TaxID=89951 RepID=A0AA47P5Y6_MERPO|nr:hypothetical protein N1851_006428 [Merluccius polli]